MEKADDLFSEIATFLDDDPVLPEAGTKDPDEDGLPFESLDDFSTSPVEFGEMAERMLHKVENLFDLTAVYNRHSAKYLRACTLLEKGIKYLGSACLTKAALERQEFSFPELGQLSTMKLYRMASFNYRKLDKALTEKLENGNDLYPELTDMEFRYFNLLRRLRSTETKIHNYHFGHDFGPDNYDPLIEGTAFSAGSHTKMYTQDREEAPAFRRAPAFPLIGRSARSTDRSTKTEKSGAAIAKKEAASGSRKSADREDQIPGGNSKASGLQPSVGCSGENGSHAKEITSGSKGCLPGEHPALDSYKDKSGRIHIDVSGLRQQLLKAAHDSGEIDLMMEIAGEPPEKLYERFRQIYGELPLTEATGRSISGPPEMPRKKLRGKRKKRK